MSLHRPLPALTLHGFLMRPCAALEVSQVTIEPMSYRPLFVHEDEPPRRELRGLGFLLLLLGALRHLPSLATDEPLGTETAIAAVMLVIGSSIVLEVPRRVRQARAAWREYVYLRDHRCARPRPRPARTIGRR